MKRALIIYFLLISECYAANLPDVPQKVILSSYRVNMTASKTTDNITFKMGGEARATAVAIGKRRLLSAGHLMLLSQMFKEMDVSYVIQVFDEEGVFKKDIKATVVKWVLMKNGFDLLEFSVDEDLPYFIKIDQENSINVGDWIYTVGAKGGLSPFNVSWGQLASKQSEIFPELCQASIVVCGGNSGGPVYSGKNNKLIGIIVRGSELSFYVPLCAIDVFLDAKKEELPDSDVTPENANRIEWPVQVKP